jgi:hypothetical protein
MKHKSLTKQMVAMLAIVVGLALAGSTQAQYITGGQYLSDIQLPASGYNGWSTATFTQTPTGIEVQAPTAGGYGGAYFVINGPSVQTLNPADTAVQLTLTVNGDATPYVWFSPGQLVLNDDLPLPTAFYYGEPYSGYNNAGNPANAVWNGNTVTLTVPLQAGQLAKIAGGSDHIYAFNLDIDPAVISTDTLDVTFNSIQLIPEPATVSLVGVALLGLLGLRRRRTS